MNKAEAHRVAHKLRDPKFYSARTKRAVNSSATDDALGLSVPFCACGRRLTECDGSRAGCTGQTGMPGVRDTKNPCDMFSPGKPTNGGCQGDGRRCRACGRWVWGGPTACDRCVGREEREDTGHA